jgi:hypothetical protein
MILGFIQAFVVKSMDNGLSTFKSIYINKEKYFLGAVYSTLSTLFYLIGVKQVANDSGYVTIVAMTIATFISTYLPGIYLKRKERDKLYIFEITASSLDAGKEFADTLRELNIPVKTDTVRDTELIKVLSCKAYCSTKDESRIVKSLIPEDFHHHAYASIE